MPRPLRPSAELLSLDHFDADLQNKKDEVERRLWQRSETDHVSGCWIYTGCWDPNGQGKIKVANRNYTLTRISAWIFLDFRLYSSAVVVRTCQTPACFNYEHLRICATKSEAWQVLWANGAFAHSGRYKVPAADVERIVAGAAAGASPAELSEEFGLTVAHVRRIIRGLRRARDSRR